MPRNAIVSLTFCWALAALGAAQTKPGSPTQTPTQTSTLEAISEKGSGKHVLQGVKQPSLNLGEHRHGSFSPVNRCISS